MPGLVLAKSGELGDLGDNKWANGTMVWADGVENEAEEALGELVNKTFVECCRASGNATGTGDQINSEDEVCAELAKQKDGGRMCRDGIEGFSEFLGHLFASIAKPVGIGCIVIAVIEILCLFASCHIMCTKSEEFGEEA